MEITEAYSSCSAPLVVAVDVVAFVVVVAEEFGVSVTAVDEEDEKEDCCKEHAGGRWVRPVAANERFVNVDDSP